MYYYTITIIVAKLGQDDKSRTIIEGTFESLCGSMPEALEKAGRYAMYFLGEEKADYIDEIRVEKGVEA